MLFRDSFIIRNGTCFFLLPNDPFVRPLPATRSFSRSRSPFRISVSVPTSIDRDVRLNYRRFSFDAMETNIQGVPIRSWLFSPELFAVEKKCFESRKLTFVCFEGNVLSWRRILFRFGRRLREISRGFRFFFFFKRNCIVLGRRPGLTMLRWQPIADHNERPNRVQ